MPLPALKEMCMSQILLLPSKVWHRLSSPELSWLMVLRSRALGPRTLKLVPARDVAVQCKVTVTV